MIDDRRSEGERPAREERNERHPRFGERAPASGTPRAASVAETDTATETELGGAAGGEKQSTETGRDILSIPPEELKKALEAVLFAVSEPLPVRSLAELFGVTVHDVRQAAEVLREEYLDGGRAFRLEDVAGGLQLLTLPAYDVWIRRLRQKQREARLSPAAFETLAVIAYKQPITKADLEGIRGVQCAPILKTLLDRGLVKVVGRDDSLGRPLLYGTTRRFLECFGINSTRDLPQPDLQPPTSGDEPSDRAPLGGPKNN